MPKTKKYNKLKNKKTLKNRTYSYSPTINKKYKHNRYIKINKNTIIPIKIDDDCDEYTLNIPNKNNNNKVICLKYNDKKVIKYLTTLLLSQRYINDKIVIAPKQITSNCWFNSFFMCFFISDKGRKFTKSFRESCITGLIPNTNIRLEDNLYKQLWLLNKYINASIYGNDYASLMNTNNIINKIYNHLKGKGIKYNFNKYSGGDAWHYFTTIVNYLYTHNKNKNPYKFLTLNFMNYNYILYNVLSKQKVHFFTIYYQKNIDIKRHKVISIYSKYEDKYINYELDSCTIDDIMSQHQSCFITINKNDYFFDGEGFNTLNKKAWKNYINTNKKFKPNKGKVGPWVKNAKKTLNFNHKLSSQRLFYYRITQ